MEERTNALNIERVQKDLEEIKKENKALLARLRGEKQHVLSAAIEFK